MHAKALHSDFDWFGEIICHMTLTLGCSDRWQHTPDKTWVHRASHTPEASSAAVLSHLSR